MTRAATFVVTLVLAAGLPPLEAQEPADGAGGATEPRSGRTAVTLREAAEHALTTHPSLSSAVAPEDGARADLDRSRAAWWPDLGLTGSATRYELPMIVRPIHDFQPGETPPFDRTLVQGGTRMTYTLFEGGGRSARVRGARAELGAAGAGVEAARQGLLADVTRAYLDVLTGRGTQDAHERRREALEAELRRVREQLEVGRAARIERLRVEAALARAEAERTSVEEEMETAWRVLGRFMDADPDSLRSRGLARVSATTADASDRPVLYRRARARNLETAVDRAAEVARIERLRLETGAGTQPDYLDAEAALLETRAQLAEARNRVVAARVELARVTGELEPAWLGRHLTGEVTGTTARADDGGQDGA